MNIHQMHLRFDAPADRLMWQLRTFGGEMFSIWLTRRLMRLLWPLLSERVTQSDIAHLMPHANVMPEAREMLTQAARDRPLPGAQFDQPFETQATVQPLGSDPLLPAGFKLLPGPGNQGLLLDLIEVQGRSMKVQLSDDLSTALMRLLDQALADADWGLASGTSQPLTAPSSMSLN